MAGHWRSFDENAKVLPYLMYDATNDSRTRPSHLALDGVIKPVGNVFWKTHACPNGHRCRCSIRQLTRQQAMAKGGVTQNVPAEGGADPGWGSDPREWGQTLGQLVRNRISLCGVTKFSADGAKSNLIHCQSEAAFIAMQRALASVDNSAVNETFIRNSVGDLAWAEAVGDLMTRTLPPGVAAAGLTMAEQVALYTWTLDTTKGPWFSRINRVLRMADTSSAEFEAVWPIIAGIKSALDKLPPYQGMIYRSVKESHMTAQQLAWFNDAYQPGKMVVLEGLSGAAKNQLQMLRGRFKLTIKSKSGRDISALSSKPGQAEVLMMHGSIIRIYKVEKMPEGAIKIWAQEM